MEVARLDRMAKEAASVPFVVGASFDRSAIMKAAIASAWAQRAKGNKAPRSSWAPLSASSGSMPSSGGRSPLTEDAPMTQTRAQLIQILTAVQNTRRFEHQDIMTFAGFMSDEELPSYIWRRFECLRASDKAVVLEVARDVLANQAQSPPLP
jgi:hypothetical protein